MYRYLTTLVFLLLSMHVHAQTFEYRCLKGGMTKAEFHAACNTAQILSNKGDYSKSEIEELLHYGFDYSGSPLEGKENYASLFWTEDDLLWRIQIRYTKSDDILRGIAQMQAISETFPNIEIKESRESSTYGSTDYMTVVLVDQAVASAAQNKIKQEILPSM
jgi:hypothetical protein